MMEALEGTSVQEGLDGDPLEIIKKRSVTGYLLISGIEESADAVLLAVNGEAIAAEFIDDKGRWLGKDAMERIRQLKGTWIDLFQWTVPAIEAVIVANPEAKLVLTKEDKRALIEERRQRRLEALRHSPTDGEKGRGLTGLFAKVSEQVKGLESEKKPSAEPRHVDVIPVEVIAEPVGSVIPAPAKPAPNAPMLTANVPRSKPQAPEPASAEPEDDGKSFEEAISEGIDELKKLSKELDSLIET